MWNMVVLRKNVPYSLRYLESQHPVISVICECLSGVVLMEEVFHQGLGSESESLMSLPVNSLLLVLAVIDIVEPSICMNEI